MLYLFDEDNQNRVPRMGYITDEAYAELVTWFKHEDMVTIQPSDLTKNDIVCFHKSFPDERTMILARITHLNEEKEIFKTIAFSGDSAFYTEKLDGNDLIIHKDKFYLNLKYFIDKNCEIEALKFGAYTKKNEASVILQRMTDMLFSYSDKEVFDLKSIMPRDLKRICDLSDYDYMKLMEGVEDITVGNFKKLVMAISKSI